MQTIHATPASSQSVQALQNRAFETHREVVIRIGDDGGDEVDILAEELGELKRVVDRIVRHACACACMSMCSRQIQCESLGFLVSERSLV